MLFVLIRMLSVTFMWLCTLAHYPPPSDSQGHGALSCWLSGRVRSLLTVKPFGDASAKLQISKCAMSIWALLRGRAAGRRHWRVVLATCLAIATGCKCVERSTSLYLPSFHSTSAVWLPGPGDGGPTHRLRPSRPCGPRSF